MFFPKYPFGRKAISIRIRKKLEENSFDPPLPEKAIFVVKIFESLVAYYSGIHTSAMCMRIAYRILNSMLMLGLFRKTVQYPNSVKHQIIHCYIDSEQIELILNLKSYRDIDIDFHSQEELEATQQVLRQFN